MGDLIPPKKRKRTSSRLNHRHLPSELIEDILLNLPHKSLVRFSAVSKSWNSIIFDPVFARKHKNKAALLRQHSLVVYIDAHSKQTSPVFSLPPTSSDLRLEFIKKRHLSSDGTGCTERSFSVFSNAKVDVRDFSSQFEGVPHLRAYCDELWCVEVKNSIFLWNPSMRNVVELPPPLFKNKGYTENDFIYGLAYDSVNDDYKIMKVESSSPHRTELYSLKSKCWREIKSFSTPHREGGYLGVIGSKRCEFVEGRFHWIRNTRAPIKIAFFDLSTEKYGEVALPKYEANIRLPMVVVLRGMLCAYVDSYKERFVLWVMEGYPVEKSWTKWFDFLLSPAYSRIIPFYLSDNIDLLVECYDRDNNYIYIFMYRNEDAKPWRWLNVANAATFITKLMRSSMWNPSLLTRTFRRIDSFAKASLPFIE